MKKIIFVFTLVTALYISHGCKESLQNIIAEKSVKLSASDNLKGAGNPDLPDSELEQEPGKPKGAVEGSPRILFILFDDPGQAAWSPSLWWSYQHTNTGLPGC